MARDYYEVLGVAREASFEEIKRSYRKLAREQHPDVNAHRREEAEAAFKEIGEAYAVLSDEQKRAMYDRYGEAGLNGGASDFGGAGVGINDIFEVFFGGGGFGGDVGGRTQESTRRGADLRYDLQLTLEESYAGVTKELKVPCLVRCDTCEGSGAAPGTQAQLCTGCGGRGRVQQVRETFFGRFVQEAPCARCAGSGKYIPNPCGTCRGDGRKRGQRNVTVRIPAGVDEGDRVRVTGAGEEGQQNAAPGDLYCFITIEPNQKFQRRGDDVLFAMSISFAQAALGDTIEVPTLARNDAGEPVMEAIEIPAGTQNATPFRISNKGFPRSRGGERRGDQICIARVITPTKLSERQKELFRELAELSHEHLDEQPRGFFDKLKDALGVD
jgi:molecular chaperone DnaJ